MSGLRRSVLVVVLLFVILGSGAAAAGSTASDQASTAGVETVSSNDGGSVAGGPGEVSGLAVDPPERAAQPSANNTTDGEDACDGVVEGTPRDDPEDDVIGWENGCWYDATFDFETESGLNRTQTEALLARTMARVERVRDLEFGRTVPVETISRDQFSDRTMERFETISEEERLTRNVTWRALLMINGTRDAVAVDRESSISGARGFYSPTENRIYLVTDGGTNVTIDERVLAHELVHVLQNQHFDAAERFELDRMSERTIEGQNRVNGLLEGDADLVRFHYRDRCATDWECVVPETGQGEANDDVHWGFGMIRGFPYNAGGRFANEIYKENGWDGVNALYEDPPTGTDVIVHPDTYGERDQVTVTYSDRSSDEWRRVGAPDDPTVESVGQPAIATMLFYPFFDSGWSRAPVVPRRSYLNTTGEALSDYYPVRYGGHEAFKGWDGDRLYPYVNETTGKTGYVWKIDWESREDVDMFAKRYGMLLEYYGAQPVDGDDGTYRIPEGNEYAGTYAIERSENAVVIVNAPNRTEINEIRAGTIADSGDGSDDGPFGLGSTFGPVILGLSLIALIGLIVVGRAKLR